MDEEMAADALTNRWSLGTNGVVKKAVRAVKKLLGGMMVALVSYSKTNSHRISQTTLSNPPQGLSDWEYINFGYLTSEKFEFALQGERL